MIKTSDLKKAAQQTKTAVTIFPTDTIYGIGTAISNSEGIEKIIQIKNRDPSKPFPVLISSFDMFENLVENPKKYNEIIDKYMPGSNTLIFPQKKDLNYFNTDTIAIRFPDNKEIINFINEIGETIVATSINNTGEPERNTIEEIEAWAKDKDIACIYAPDESIQPTNKPSNIYKINEDLSTLKIR
ncbi:L-threonylcarbamoyladenylate synthase [Candidatus Margulisiibacteriota bacterium]